MQINKTSAILLAMLAIGASIVQMVHSRSLHDASVVLHLCFFLMLGIVSYAGGRSPRKALRALVLALVCGSLLWS